VTWKALHFIGEEIEPIFKKLSTFSKKPDPPSGFHWRDSEFLVETLISTWFDFERKGRMEKNMRPSSMRKAARRGSWGVGRYYFRIRTTDDRAFDIYYDRAPSGADDREGRWILWREIQQTD
jgi:hypothetical protein